jgi:hypothetical protein
MNTEKLNTLCQKLLEKPTGKLIELDDIEVRLIGIILEPEPILFVSVPGFKSPWQVGLDQFICYT